ncbi:MAG: VOC family protein [Bdellovibrionales bacterium]|nr:VOC family protein [Bdellovibrionales bacterium]
MAQNPLGLKRFGPITFAVTDAEKQRDRLCEMLGMVPFCEKTKLYGIRCVDTIFYLDGSPQGKALATQYGNHIREIGLYVEDSKLAFTEAKKRAPDLVTLCNETGAIIIQAPHDGEVFFKLTEVDQSFHADMKPLAYTPPEHPAFQRIDHIVTNTQTIKPVIDFMHQVFGMEKVNEFTIQVKTDQFQASLFSEVMGLHGTDSEILFPVNEPLPGDDESQIPAQLREMGRSHAQHIALATDDIISSIRALKQKGLGFLEFRNEEHAKQYYQEVPDRLGKITVEEAMQTLRDLGILVDKCGEGYLLQLFSKRMFPGRSVPFIEIIQRASDVIGCFGDGNFAALAESLEHSMRQERLTKGEQS